MYRFPAINPEARRQFYFFCTSHTSSKVGELVKDVLENEPLSTVHMLYYHDLSGEVPNRDLYIELTDYFHDQFYIQFYLVHTPLRPIPFSNRKHSRLNAEGIQEFVTTFLKQSLPQLFLIYMSEPLASDVQSFLHHLGIGNADMYIAKLDDQDNATELMSKCKAKIRLDGNDIELEITDQTVLQTLIDAGYDPPFSCASGVCTTCMAKLNKGKVDMEENYGLDEDEVADGYILTCQSKPTTEEIEVDYDL